MNKKVISGLLMLSLFVIACSHYDNLEKNGKESSANSDSHNSGKDCASCHNNASNEASREYWWNIAGTVHENEKPTSNISVQLWSEPLAKGFRIKNLISDKDGNFYTEKVVNLNGGCYPIAIRGNDTLFMDAKKYTGGGCNSCHNPSSNEGILNF
jgi:cytochrome c553